LEVNTTTENKRKSPNGLKAKEPEKFSNSQILDRIAHTQRASERDGMLVGQFV